MWISILGEYKIACGTTRHQNRLTTVAATKPRCRRPIPTAAAWKVAKTSQIRNNSHCQVARCFLCALLQAVGCTSSSVLAAVSCVSHCKTSGLLQSALISLLCHKAQGVLQTVVLIFSAEERCSTARQAVVVYTCLYPEWQQRVAARWY